MNKNIEKAVNTLNSGGVIIFPTDTAFGIGCRIDNDAAIKKLVRVRKRREGQPLPVLVSDFKMAKKYLKAFSEKEIYKIVDRYWPGGLTIVLPCKEKIVNPIIRGNSHTLGVRMPDHEEILEVIRRINVPLVGCSANFPGEKTPFLFKDINKKLIKSVDFVIEGECAKKQSSTVIDCSKKPWKILRQGAVSTQELREVKLIIDTSSNEYISVGLEIEGKRVLKKQKIDFQKAQVVLPMIDNILSLHKLSLGDLTSIVVNEGPGSFTGLRVGISITNTLGHFLKIPINNKKPMDPVAVVYK